MDSGQSPMQRGTLPFHSCRTSHCKAKSVSSSDKMIKIGKNLRKPLKISSASPIFTNPFVLIILMDNSKSLYIVQCPVVCEKRQRLLFSLSVTTVAQNWIHQHLPHPHPPPQTATCNNKTRKKRKRTHSLHNNEHINLIWNHPSFTIHQSKFTSSTSEPTKQHWTCK